MTSILAIDDTQDNLDVISLLLKQLIDGCTVITAQSGFEGIRKAEAELPDTILLDIKMPKMDGFEVCKRLKSNEKTKHIPIVMLTGIKIDAGSRIKGLEIGADAFLAKPVDGAELAAQVKAMLRIKQTEDILREKEILLEETVLKRTSALQESEKRFRALVEGSLVGIFIIQNGQIVYQNPEQSRLFGPQPELFEVQSTHFKDLEEFIQFWEKELSEDTPTLEMEVKFFPFGGKAAQGCVRWVHCRATLIEYQKGKAILVNMVDITTNKDLKRLVLMREKMVSLGHVAAGIAHEIRNPLSGINVFLDVIKESLESSESVEDIKELVDQVQGAANKIESVVKRVLDFSRPGTPKLTLVDMNIPIREALNLSRTSLRKEGITMEADLAQNLPLVYIDSQLIEQAVLNLITNAAEALRNIKDQKSINITSTVKEGYVVVKVSDSGLGISPDVKDKIFDPFYTTKSDGAGIGLSICQRIIVDHGGNMDISISELGGAEVAIRIPIDKRKP